MASLLKKLSKIDNKTKYVVYGWIRRAEDKLELGHIPMMISSICILYYHQDEIFHIVSKNVKVSKDRKSLIKVNPTHSSFKNTNFI